MRVVILSFTAVAAVAVAAFAHRHLRRHVRGTAVRVILLRLFLLVTGALFGYTAAAGYRVSGVDGALVWLIGFGLVHVPAATILFIKDRRAK